jgi:hypothetical protein
MADLLNRQRPTLDGHRSKSPVRQSVKVVKSPFGVPGYRRGNLGGNFVVNWNAERAFYRSIRRAEGDYVLADPQALEDILFGAKA